MSVHLLDKLFNPTSIAVIGASDRPNSVGMKVFNNLLKGPYTGKLYAVNPKHKKIQGEACFATVKDISPSVDLAIITTPAQTVPQIIKECGEKGVAAAVIISAGFSETGEEGKALEQAFLQAAKQHNVRLIGPNCLGIMRPSLNLNATFDNNIPLAGQVALVSQSGAICAAILDWAANKKIGFSSLVSLGNAADLDFGEILDFLAHDSKTKSILLYIEGIHDAERFMSGLRAATAKKPVIVIKGGRHAQGSRAAHSHTGALVGDDDAFDAALQQAGAVRVATIEQLFSAAEVLSSNYHAAGNRLAIITNGGGAGVMAADHAAEAEVMLNQLSDASIKRLNKTLPTSWSHQNPIDIIGDAPPERYHDALQICAKDDNFDGLLIILVPVSMANPLKVAEQIIADAKSIKKPILACWMGEKQVKSSWALFAKNNIPCFSTPEQAVEAFSYLADYQRNQQLLLQIQKPTVLQPKPDVKKAQAIMAAAAAEKRTTLTTTESKAILQAFHIPTTQPIITKTADDAVKAAESVAFPVAMKIYSPDITHKQDVGGVQLNIDDKDAVRKAFNQIMANAKQAQPKANIIGVTVEPMYKNPNNRELMIGIMRDKVFGPVITVGLGGTLVEIIQDRAIALPPLNDYLAIHLISKTRAAKLLAEFRNMPPANIDALINVLLRVSELIHEIPNIQEMDINPLIVNDKETIAVDARIIY